MKDNDPVVEDDDYMYWRAPRLPLTGWTITDEASGVTRIASGSILMNPDGMSCYSRRVLWVNLLCWRVTKIEPINRVLRLSVGDIRSLSLGVAQDPNPDDIEDANMNPRDLAHSLIVHNLPTSQFRKKKSALAKLACAVEDGSLPAGIPIVSEPLSGHDPAGCGGGTRCAGCAL